jgi:hypothetical protein
MSAVAGLVADNARVGVRNLLKLCESVPADGFGKFARPGGVLVESNHPAFIVGHLALYPAKTMELLGLKPDQSAVPAGYEELFSQQYECQDDPDGTIYPSKDELIPFFELAYGESIAALGNASAEQLLAENPNNTPIKELCPTLGSMLGFYMSGHVTLHVGQLSAWRRMMGLGRG